MGKALIIPNVDFSAIAVAQVTIDTDPVPCESITLNKSSVSLQNVGTTEKLTATVFPADTTDTVTWTSSDDSVATVNNGEVTVVGIGTATITATCGRHSASCEVSTRCFMVPNLVKVNGVYVSGVGVADSGNGLPTFSTSDIRGTWAGETGVFHLYGGTGGANNYYPYRLPSNTKSIKITADKSSYTAYRIALIDALTATTPYNSATLIKNLPMDSIPATSDGYLLPIPTIDGYSINAVCITMRNMSGTFVDEDYDNVTIEFLRE